MNPDRPGGGADASSRWQWRAFHEDDGLRNERDLAIHVTVTAIWTTLAFLSACLLVFASAFGNG
jgi:hypothetical protein